MSRESPRLQLSRAQILGFRRRAGSLDERLPPSAKSLRLAAWAGLQDSMPRAALLSLHGRVAGCNADHWEHGSLVQLWGPRYNVYVVAAKDLPLFSLGRLPDDARGRAQDTASRLHACLGGRQMPTGEAGRVMGVNSNSLRYAATTETVLLRWDGAVFHQGNGRPSRRRLQRFLSRASTGGLRSTEADWGEASGTMVPLGAAPGRSKTSWTICRIQFGRSTT